jgi:hypothetical protein
MYPIKEVSNGWAQAHHWLIGVHGGGVQTNRFQMIFDDTDDSDPYSDEVHHLDTGADENQIVYWSLTQFWAVKLARLMCLNRVNKEYFDNSSPLRTRLDMDLATNRLSGMSTDTLGPHYKSDIATIDDIFQFDGSNWSTGGFRDDCLTRPRGHMYRDDLDVLEAIMCAATDGLRHDVLAGIFGSMAEVPGYFRSAEWSVYKGAQSQPQSQPQAPSPLTMYYSVLLELLMYGVYLKFRQNPGLAAMLVDTEDIPITCTSWRHGCRATDAPAEPYLSWCRFPNWDVASDFARMYKYGPSAYDKAIRIADNMFEVNLLGLAHENVRSMLRGYAVPRPLFNMYKYKALPTTPYYTCSNTNNEHDYEHIHEVEAGAHCYGCRLCPTDKNCVTYMCTADEEREIVCPHCGTGGRVTMDEYMRRLRNRSRSISDRELHDHPRISHVTPLGIHVRKGLYGELHDPTEHDNCEDRFTSDEVPGFSVGWPYGIEEIEPIEQRVKW